MGGNNLLKTRNLLTRTFVILLPAFLGAQSRMTYELHYRAPGRGRVQVRIVPAAPLEGPRPFVFPRAVPMGYGEQPFDRFVVDLRAWSGDGRALPVARIEGPRWKARGPGLRHRGTAGDFSAGDGRGYARHPETMAAAPGEVILCAPAS